jgi:tryptophanyl-tRNA synthetase
MQSLRQAVGLRRLQSESAVKSVKVAKSAGPAFKQYRDTDGKFYFKLLDAQAHVMLQSKPFDTPKEAGHVIALLKVGGLSGLSKGTDFVNEILQSELQLIDKVLKNM